MKIYTDLDLRGNKLINAELEDPSFDGDVTVPTRPVGDNSTKVANTAFVHNEIIASVDDELSTESEKAVQNKVVTENLEKKADTDKIYPDLTAGTALQLLGNTYTEDKTPYNFRKSGGSINVGTRGKDKIIGGTIAWNQAAQVVTGSGSYGNDHVTVTRTADTYKVQIVSDGENPSTDNAVLLSNNIYQTKVTAGHKYLFSLGVSELPQGTAHKFFVAPSTSWSGAASVISGTRAGAVIVAIPTGDYKFGHWYFSTSANNAFNITLTPQIFDLTQMFGSTIADYIYSLEQANAGAGVAYFRSLSPKPYYDYNAGELMSVKTSAHNMVGFNALDIENGYYSTNCDLVGSTLTNIVTDSLTYFSPSLQVMQGSTPIVRIAPTEATTIDGRICRKYTIPSGYDYGNGYTIRLKHSGSTRDILLFETTNVIAGAEYCISILQEGTNPSVVGGLKLTDINLNISSTRNGEYEPYELHSYPLDADLELRGIPKLDANNQLYYDGDIYEADGTVTRKYWAVDLGALNWGKNGDGNLVFATNSLTTGSHKAKGAAWSSGVFNGIISNGAYRAIRGSDVYNHVYDMIMGMAGDGMFYIYDSAKENLTGPEFKTAMSGVYLVYELATPTTEAAAPYAEIQIVSPYGTEEYVDERAVAIPVGHDTEYPTDLVAKIEEIPDPPTADGTYTLKAVVSGGVATYSWG